MKFNIIYLHCNINNHLKLKKKIQKKLMFNNLLTFDDTNAVTFAKIILVTHYEHFYVKYSQYLKTQ